MKQSVLTKKMNLSAATFFLMILTISQISSAAVTRLPQINFGSRPSARTEGTICSDCAVRAPQNSLMGQLAQLDSGTEKIFNAAYLNDNGERSNLYDLRNRRARGERLTTEQKAILQASDRIGLVFWPGCINSESGREVEGNATLIKIDGRDAIITSAHFIKNDNGVLHGDCDLDDYSKATFMPNYSYYGQTGQSAVSDSTVFREVRATADRRFGDFNNDKIRLENDWIVLYLDEQISNKPAPNTSAPRGFVEFASAQPEKQTVPGYILGLDERQGPGKTTFQACDVVADVSQSYNSCDTDGGSSGSLVGVLENGEIKLHGINNRNSDALPLKGEHPTPSDYKKWNHGVSSDHISDEIQQVLNPQGIDT